MENILLKCNNGNYPLHILQEDVNRTIRNGTHFTGDAAFSCDTVQALIDKIEEQQQEIERLNVSCKNLEELILLRR